MDIYRILLLVFCSATARGLQLFQCRGKTKLRCGPENVSFYRCRELGGCYRWTLRGSKCCFTTNSAVNPETRRSRYPEYSWQMKRTTVQHPTAVCQQNGLRTECGYPGIDSKQCRARGCCWDATTLGLHWCFRPTIPTPLIRPHSTSLPSNRLHSYSPFRQENKYYLVGNTISHKFPYGNKVVGTKQTTKPINAEAYNNFYWNSPATTAITTTTTTSRDPSFIDANNEKKLTPAEQEFLLQVNKELVKSPPIPISFFPPVFLNQRLSGSQSLNRRQYRFTTTTTSTTTTTTSTTTPINLNNIFHFRIPRPQNQNQQELHRGLVPVRSPFGGQAKKLRQAIALLRLLHESQRNNGPAPSPSNIKRCELETPDSCCLTNPNGSCCGFRHTVRLSERPAPLPRVVGGTPAGNLRYSVAHLSKRPDRHHFCGGTVLSREWVLTAAHCVLSYCERFTRNLVVSLGKYRKSVFPRERWQQDFDVIRVVCHPDQCRAGEKPRLNDVALLRLSRPVVYNSFIQPSLLPYPYETPLVDRNCMALGWGNTKGSGFADVLKEVSVPAFSNEQCTHPDWRGCLVKSCMICAGDVNTDPCDGDSGGPLFCQRSSGLYVLHGIFSWGRCGASEKKPSIYTRSSHFINWIHDVIRSS